MNLKKICDFQRFLLFRNKARNAGRSRKNAGNKAKCGISRTIAGRLTPMQWEVVSALSNQPSTQGESPPGGEVGNHVTTQREHLCWRIAVEKDASEIARHWSLRSATYLRTKKLIPFA